MAKLFATSINLNKNELQNARIQNLSANPSNGVAGQIYFNTIDNELRTFDGTQWVGSGSIQYGLEQDRPAPSKGGLLYATTDTKVMYLDNGSEWVQVGIGPDTVDTLTNKTIAGDLNFNDGGINSKIYAFNNDLTVKGYNNLNLTTNNGNIILNADGSSYIGNDNNSDNRIAITGDLANFISTGDNASLNSLTITSNGLGQNVQIGDDAWLGDVNLGNTVNIVGVENSNEGYVSFGQNGSLIDNTGQKKNYIGSDSVDLTLGSSNDIILRPNSGYAYLGLPTLDGHNRIATLGDISAGAITSISGTTDQITVTMDGEAATLSLPSYIDVPNGELHLKKTEYWNNGSQYGIVAANSYGNKFTIAATGHDLELESQSGHNTFINTGNTTQITGNYFNSSAGQNYFANSVYIGSDSWNETNQSVNFGIYNNQGVSEFFVDTDNDVINFIRRGNVNSVRVNLGQYANNVELNNYTNLVFNGGDQTDQQGYIGIDGGMYIQGSNNSELGLSTSNNRIYLDAGNDNHIDFYTGTSSVRVHNNQEVYNDLTVGNHGNDSTFYVKKGDGTEVFRVATAADQVKLWGQLKAYGANDGGQYFNMYTDSGSEAILNAPNGDLILQADGSSYLHNNNSQDNRIATIGDINAASSGLTWKQAANLLWNDSNAFLTGDTNTLVIDGHAALTSAHNGYRILITNGANAGIWEYQDNGSTWTLTRPADADTDAELKGAAIFIMEGNNYGSTSWVQSNHYVGNTGQFAGQDWHQFSGQGTYTGSNSVFLDGTSINVQVNNESGLDVGGSGLFVKTGNGIEFDNDGNVAVALGSGLDFNAGRVTFAESYGVRKAAFTIGDNSATSFDLVHNFNTRQLTVQIFQTASPYAQIEADIERTTASKVTVKFASAPANDEYEVVIVG